MSCAEIKLKSFIQALGVTVLVTVAQVYAQASQAPTPDVLPAGSFTISRPGDLQNLDPKADFVLKTKPYELDAKAGKTSNTKDIFKAVGRAEKFNMDLIMAGGAGNTGGGTPTGLSFANQAYNAIEEMDETLLPSPWTKKSLSDLVDGTLFFAVSETLIIEVKGHPQECLAINVPKYKLVIFDAAKWIAISGEESRTRIALHEVLSIAGLEKTGDYHISAKTHLTPLANEKKKNSFRDVKSSVFRSAIFDYLLSTYEFKNEKEAARAEEIYGSSQTRMRCKASTETIQVCQFETSEYNYDRLFYWVHGMYVTVNADMQVTDVQIYDQNGSWSPTPQCGAVRQGESCESERVDNDGWF